MALCSAVAAGADVRGHERRAARCGDGRDPLQYTVAVYGNPASPPWGWKIEGHHLSLNFTIGATGGLSVTPAFLGANPAEVRSGPRAGTRVLAKEEDLARELVLSFGPEQRSRAIIAAEAPADILTSPGRDLDAAPAAGLAQSSMTDSQKELLDRLIREYVENLRGDVGEQELQRIRDAGMDKISFAWAGATERGKGHYYRITGPTFVIEYDNTQNDANHVHTVWHDRERNFGRDLLREHIEKDHGRGK